MKNVKTFNEINESINYVREKLANMIVEKHGFHVVEDPSFHTTDSQVVLEKDDLVRIVLDSEGESDVCSIAIFSFDKSTTMNLEWQVHFGFNTPVGAVSSFIGALQ